MKFSRELEAQLIPEWKNAFVDYWQLKKHIKKIKLAKMPSYHKNQEFGCSILDSMRRSTVTERTSCMFSCSGNKNDIQMSPMSRRVFEEGVSGDIELAQLFSFEDEVSLFFERLNEELDKVNEFYSNMESEFLERREALDKQLDILVEIKRVLSEQQGTDFVSRQNAGISPESWPSSIWNPDSPDGLTEASEEGSLRGELVAPMERNGNNFISLRKAKNINPKMGMKIDIPAATPTQIIVSTISSLWEHLVNNPKKDGPGDFIFRKKVQCAEKMIRKAFVELYKGLTSLRLYCSLNMVAFTKILKKYDKVADQKASATYIYIVNKSPFISSDKVMKVMDEVEQIFTKHFASNDRKKTMKFLRSGQPNDSHMVTFFVGLLTGCFVSFFIVYAILAHTTLIFYHNAKSAYMDSIYPIFSLFALLSLHLFIYGCNLYSWKVTRINYIFIFDFSPKTALKYRDAFLICTTAMIAVVVAMVLHLLLQASAISPSKVKAVPGILILISVMLLICPLDILYRPTRYCFLRIMHNIALSPFYKVVMADFFMADQLTSQVFLLKHIASTACCSLTGNSETDLHKIYKSGRSCREVSHIFAFLPYYWRAMQCARRWFDEGEANHLANMGKYLSAMVAAGARMMLSSKKDSFSFSIILFTSVSATIYQLYWDFVKDWGLLSPNSVNPWLRDNLMLKNKSIYYMSIALNAVLRIVWVQSVLPFHYSPVEERWLEFLLASLEVIRRGHWNFYRLENEHLNNVGKFRAVKEIPVPFLETDSDG